MRAKLLVLIALLILVSFVCSCAVDMSTKGKETPSKRCEIHRIEKPATVPIFSMVAGEGEKALVLIKHSDGYFYVVDMKSASARKVGGIKPCGK